MKRLACPFPTLVAPRVYIMVAHADYENEAVEPHKPSTERVSMAPRLTAMTSGAILSRHTRSSGNRD